MVKASTSRGHACLYTSMLYPHQTRNVIAPRQSRTNMEITSTRRIRIPHPARPYNKLSVRERCQQVCPIATNDNNHRNDKEKIANSTANHQC